ncbi:hypothetical protein [Nostoc sp. FACHB-110]|uniref:hypothetical protein n=1 Tax=Nostoc sp. FACHB-110 TaxID=2692834 RepID=UPI001683227A|nr:hypothetical protein [Nostoc sp. FACHB-110]MBD2438804.1 hypothetical protein [Nostoc sp. FACHB-110]
MSDFKDLKNRVIISSLGTASLGVFLWFTPAKPLTNWIIAASIGGLVSAELITHKAEKCCKRKILNLENEADNLKINLKAERDLNLCQQAELTNKESLLANSALAYKILSQGKEKLEVSLATLAKELENYRLQIKSLQVANGETATEIMQDSFQEFQSGLNALISSLNRRYPNLNKDWSALSNQFDVIIKLFAAKVSTIISQTNAKDLIEMSLAMQHEIISTGSMLKVKAYKSVITYLTREFDEVVFKNEHEEIIQELNASWQAKNQEIVRTYQNNFEAIKQEFNLVAETVITGYQEDFKSIVDEGMSQAEQIEELQKHILGLQKKLEQSSKPHRFPAAVEQSRVGNAIIDYYYRAGITLDAIDWDDNETGYKLMFHVGRNGSRFISVDILNTNDAPQKLKEVSGAINTPEFKLNTRGGHAVLDIQTRHPKKKDVSREEIDALWIGAKKFESYVRRWERVRITAGSTGGKSPTAKNLALAIIKSRQGKGEIRLYDPQHGSKKDFWDMPKAGTSHEDNVEGMKELCQLLDDRTKAKKGNNQFILYIFDEIDSTIAKYRSDGYAVKDLVVYSLSQGSHQDLGVIYIGQAADANTIPGMSHSQWNNAVQLHIGSNAGIWLDKATTITTEDKNRLREKYRKIQEFCDRMNEELGLDVYTDAAAYRFALAVPLTGIPQFIQLPAFDSYDYHEVMSTNTYNGLNININQSPSLTTTEQVLSTKIQCPECGSENFKLNGKTQSRQPIQKYQCKDCKHNYKASDLIN